MIANLSDLEIEEIVVQMNLRLHPAHQEFTSDEVAALVEAHLGSKPKGEAIAVTSGPSSNVGAAA